MAEVKVGNRRFAIESTLGEGANGVVYVARDRETGARAALKTLRAVTPAQIAQLKNEFRAMQRLCHPNLVRLGEIFEDAGQWYLLMEHVEGTDFLRYVSDARGSFDEARLRAALGQLAKALRALHAARVVHRDLKPSNVLVTTEGRVVVVDFGIALREEVRRRDDGVYGTALYMAPEQALGDTVGNAADWYAVGVMLFRALTGQHPFEGLPFDVMQQKVERPAPSPNSLASGLPVDLAELAERLLAIDPATRAGYAEVAECLHLSLAPPARGPDTPTMFGRDRELAWLFEQHAASRAKATTAVLYGESGIGKSLLMQTFIERLQSERSDTVVLMSRCYHRAAVPFKAFDGAAEALVGVLNELPTQALESCLSEHAGLIPRLFPELGLVPALAERARSLVVDDPREARRRSFQALRFLFAGLAAAGPLLLAIDDLQWTDEDSVALLRAILEPPGAPPILLLVTLRVTSETAGRGRDVVRRIAPDARVCSLEKLGPSEADRFVRELIDHEHLTPPSAEVLGEMLAEADGHPMFLRELAHQGWARGEDRGHHKLRDVLRERIEMLSGAARRALVVVCTAGRPLAQRVVVEAATLLGAELFGVVPELDAARLIQTSAAGGETFIEPSHSRVRDVIHGMLTAEELQVWHGKIALALERNASDDAETLAAHWLGAGNRRRALDYVRKAADQALKSLAFDRAAQNFAAAIELSDDASLSRALRVGLADALTLAGRGAEAARACLLAADMASADDALELRRRAAEQFLTSGHLLEGRATFESVLAHVHLRLAPTTLRAIVALLVLRAWVLLRGLRLRVREASSIPVATLRRIDVCWTTSTGLSVVDNVRAAEFSARQLALALDAGDPVRYCRALVVESCFLGSQGARGRARRMLERARPMADSGSPYLKAFHELGVGWQAYFNGEFRAARDHCQRSRDLFEAGALGARWERDMGAYWALCGGVFIGELPEVAQRVPRYLRDAQDRGDLFFETLLRLGHTAVHWLATDDADSLREAVRTLLPRWPADQFLLQHLNGLWSQTLAELYDGGGAASAARYDEAWPAIQRGMHLRTLFGRARALQLRAAAHLGAAEGAASPAIHLARAKRDALSLLRLRAPWPKGWAHLLLAAVAFREHRPEQTRDRLVAAIAALDRSDLGLHLAAAEVRLGELLGGDEGRARKARGLAFLERQGVRRPENMLRTLAPGFAAIIASRGAAAASSSRSRPGC